jgi:DNA polymerase III delta prime subunit
MFVDYAKWIRSQVVTVRIGDEQKLYGWHTEHVMQPLYNSRYIDLWATREYFIYLMQYRAMQCENIAWDLVKKNDFKVSPYKQPNWYLSKNEDGDKIIIKKWNDKNPPKPLEYWNDNIVPGYRTLHTVMGDLNVYNKIGENFLNRNDSDECKWSMLLYGPPGTGKSTIAQNLADALRWPLITITPSDFIQTGGELVESRAKQIFRSLELMQDVVVLFDEIDRLILDRDSRLYSEQNDTFQFMTPGMLVKLRDLWKAKRVIFVICTNYEERIDMAAKRRGRIDEQLLVLPPDWSNRIRILVQELIVNQEILKEKYQNNYDKKDLIRKFGTAISDLYTFDVEHNQELHVERDEKLQNEYKILKHDTFLYGYDEIKNLAKNILEINNSKGKALSKICDMIKEKIEQLKSHDKYEIDKKNLPEKKRLFNEIFELFSNRDETSSKLDPPMIRINALSHRFHSDKAKSKGEFKTVQQPFYEFYGLCAMLALYCNDISSELKDYLKRNNDLKDMSIKILKNGNENANRLKEYIKIKKIDFAEKEIESLCKVLNEFADKKKQRPKTRGRQRLS